MPARRRGGGAGGGGAPLLAARRVLTAAELQGIGGASYQILPAAPTGVSYSVHRIFFEHTSNGNPAFGLRYNPDLAIVLGPESTTGGLNANTGSENFSAYVFRGDFDNYVGGGDYTYKEAGVDHSLVAGAALLVGLVGTLINSDRTKLAAITASLALTVEYDTRAIA